MEIAEAIILNVVDYDERDGIITAFFKDGRIMTIYAQGIQGSNSKNRLNLMQYSVVELEYFQKRDRSKGKLMRSTTKIEPTMKNLADINLLVGLVSLIEFRLAAGTHLYKILKFIIKEIEFRSVAPTLILHYLFMVLKLDHVYLKLDQCAICGNEDYLITFDAKAGGMICEYDLKPYNKKLKTNVLSMIQLIDKERELKQIENIPLSYDDYELVRNSLLDYFEDILGLFVKPLRKI